MINFLLSIALSAAATPSRHAQGGGEYLAGYLIVPVEQKVDRSFNGGYSMYVAAWPLQRTYPGHQLDIRLRLVQTDEGREEIDVLRPRVRVHHVRLACEDEDAQRLGVRARFRLRCGMPKDASQQECQDGHADDSTAPPNLELAEHGKVGSKLKVVVEARGLEPLTPCLQSRCSPN